MEHRVRAQSSSTVSKTPVLSARRRVNAVVLGGLAAILSKSRSALRGEPLRLWCDVAPEEQADLLLDATRAVNGQDPAISRRAHDLALERAEEVLVEEGTIDSPQARALARRIAAEAILTHRLALQGTLDSSLSTGGVQ
jgi:hypothetical protein